MRESNRDHAVESATSAVVVVNYGSSALIAANLRADVIADSGCMVVVVDNFSSRAERAAIGDLCDERGWVLVARDGNEGFGAGVNRGVEAAIQHGASVFITLNPDAVADAEVLRALVAEVRDDPRRLVSPIVQDSTGRIVYAGAQMNTRTGAMRRGWGDTADWHNWLTGACLAYSIDVHDALGGFAEDYFLYWEDVDFSRRAARAGFELTLRPDLMVVHDEGGTQSRASARTKSDTYYYYNARNRLLFARRHHPDARWAFAASTPRETLQIWLRGGRRQLLTRPQGLLATLKGGLAGLLRLVGPVPRHRRPVGRSRTVLITHPSPDLYGSDRVLVESVAGFVEAGHRVVVALPKDGPLVPELEEAGCEVVFCPAPVLRKGALRPRGFVELLRDSIRAWPRARSLLRAVQPDLVFVNTITTFLWLAAARGRGRRVVCHVHEAEASAPALLRKGLYAPLLLADHLVANSRFTVEVLADAWPALAARADIVANGVPGPADATAPRPELDEVRLLFVGRLSPRKGPQVAVQALELLRQSGRPAHLGLLGAVFEGYEWFEAELRSLVAEAGLTDQVTFLGFDPDVWGHIAAHDVVCVPSIVEESFGNTAVEAMLAQRPLVVSAMSGLLEASADYATVRRVTPGDPAALADAVCDLVDDWPAVVDATAADRALAVSRHAPAVYRRALVDAVMNRWVARPKEEIQGP